MSEDTAISDPNRVISTTPRPGEPIQLFNCVDTVRILACHTRDEIAPYFAESPFVLECIQYASDPIPEDELGRLLLDSKEPLEIGLVYDVAYLSDGRIPPKDDPNDIFLRGLLSHARNTDTDIHIAHQFRNALVEHYLRDH